jgi:hypothetical protein
MFGAFAYEKSKPNPNGLSLAGVFGLSIRLREIGVGIFQHFVLVPMTQLTGEGAVLRAALAVRVWGVVFHCTLADPFVGAGLCWVCHGISWWVRGYRVKGLMTYRVRLVGWHGR